MLELVGIGALGLAAYYLAPSNVVSSTKHSHLDDELREAWHTGFLMSPNTSNANSIRSEETAVVRAPRVSSRNAKIDAMRTLAYYKQKNDIIAELGNGVNVHINRGTLMPNNRQKPGILILPSKEGYYENFKDIPNATYDLDSGISGELMTSMFSRDQYGTAGANPVAGRTYDIPSALYGASNPWGAGGQLFVAVGNEYRTPEKLDNRPVGILKKNPSQPLEKMKKRVKFQ